MSRGAEYKDDVMKIGKLYDIEELRRLGGIVDYVVGTPLTKVYCLAEHPDPKQQHYLNLYKMGDGPALLVLSSVSSGPFRGAECYRSGCALPDSVAKPLGGPVVEVCAVAKRDLKAGEMLDDYGMYMTYGEAVNADEMSDNRYLPEGLVEGCKLKRDIAKDTVLTYDDVELPQGRLADQLRAQQYRHFRGETWLEERIKSQQLSGACFQGMSMPRQPREDIMKVVLFCGGFGMRMREYSEALPKPMVADWLSSHPVACNEVLRPLRTQRLYFVFRLQG